MSDTSKTRTKRTEEVEIPDVVESGDAQLAVYESMSADPATGAKVRIGTPERDDQEEVGDFILWLQEKADANQVDEVSRIADMLRRANTAESVADALRGAQTMSGKEFVGVGFMLLSFEIHEGEFEQSTLPYFASMRVSTPNYPDGLILNCGGEKILVHLYALERLNAFPVPMRLTSTSTRKGYTVLDFELLKQNAQ